MSVYYHPKKNKIEIFQVDNSIPGQRDFSWYQEGFGWSKNKKGKPEDYGWVHIGKTDFKTKSGKWVTE